MTMLSNPGVRRSIALALAVSAVGGIALAQVRVSPGIKPLYVPDVSTSERIAALEQGLKAEQAKSADLQNQVYALSKIANDASNQASQAKTGVNIALNDINQMGDSNKAILTGIEGLETHLGAIDDRVQDIQRRQAITCMVSTYAFGHSFPVGGFNVYSDGIQMCKGVFWNPGLAQKFLDGMIPFTAK